MITEEVAGVAAGSVLWLEWDCLAGLCVPSGATGWASSSGGASGYVSWLD